MDSDIIEYIGYHATSTAIAKIINAEGFIPSKSGWLGKGVYFFQDDKELASVYGQRRYKCQRIEIIKKNIRAPKNSVLDISDPLGKHYKMFSDEKVNLIKEAEKKGYRLYSDTISKYEITVLEELCKQKGFSLVRACTYTYQQYDERYGSRSNFPNGIELCVKDLSYIISNEEVI